MSEQPGYTPDELLRGLSLRRRAGYAVAGLAGVAGAALLAILWATEPRALPARTQLAFAALIVVGLTWGVFAGWVLTRHPMFASDRLVAAALAVGFSTLTTAGSVAIAFARGSTAGVFASLGAGLALTAIAAIMLARARTYRTLLLARKRQLELPVSPGNDSLHDTAATLEEH